MTRLQHRWNRRIEAATREFEYGAQREEQSKAEALAALPAPNSIPGQSRTAAKKARRRLPLSKAQMLRKQAIIGVLELKLTGLDYCRELDRRKLPTPTRWKEDGCPATYGAAYKIPEWTHRIQHGKSNFDRLRRQLGAAEVASILAGPTRRTR
jgi:hypothetical protein